MAAFCASGLGAATSRVVAKGLSSPVAIYNLFWAHAG